MLILRLNNSVNPSDKLTTEKMQLIVKKLHSCLRYSLLGGFSLDKFFSEKLSCNVLKKSVPRWHFFRYGAFFRYTPPLSKISIAFGLEILAAAFQAKNACLPRRWQGEQAFFGIIGA
jgi:hypothetical protein